MLALLLPASPAIAAENDAGACRAHVGQTIAPQTFEAVQSLLRQIPNEKGEFETTAAFEQRVSKARGALPKSIFVSAPLDTKHVVYNADKARFDVASYAIQNLNSDYSSVFGYGAKLAGKVPFNPANENVAVTLSSAEVMRGSYAATNAFGVRATVVKIDRNEDAIFDRSGSLSDKLFGFSGSTILKCRWTPLLREARKLRSRPLS